MTTSTRCALNLNDSAWILRFLWRLLWLQDLRDLCGLLSALPWLTLMFLGTVVLNKGELLPCPLLWGKKQTKKKKKHNIPVMVSSKQYFIEPLLQGFELGTCSIPISQMDKLSFFHHSVLPPDILYIYLSVREPASPGSSVSVGTILCYTLQCSQGLGQCPAQSKCSFFICVKHHCLLRKLWWRSSTPD